jgi:hypothetical protein
MPTRSHGIVPGPPPAAPAERHAMPPSVATPPYLNAEGGEVLTATRRDPIVVPVQPGPGVRQRPSRGHRRAPGRRPAGRGPAINEKEDHD